VKSLSQLLQNIPELGFQVSDVDPVISTIAGTIQDCIPGSLFVADFSETVDRERMCQHLDGAEFIPQAIEAGAQVILTRPDVSLSPTDRERVLLLQHEDPLQFLGSLAAHFYEHITPGFVGAVTGTNGKTSTVNFAAQLFGLAGKDAVSVGNMGVRDPSGRLVDVLGYGLSVPETVDLHRMLRTFSEQGKHAFFTEATSHAICYHRLHGMTCHAAAITNLTHDHLDFHGTMERYFQAKARLFTEILSTEGIAILNADMDYFEELRMMCTKMGRKVIEYGKNATDLKLLSHEHVDQGLRVRFAWEGKEYTVTVPVLGHFQAYNLLCALAFALVAKLKLDDLITLIPQLRPIQGRMELAGYTSKRAAVYIDHAHTPDGLLKALQFAQDIKKKRVICVLSCDGERDQDKRPKMGKISEDYADFSIVTDGIPRSENRLDIRNAILSGFKRSDSQLSIEGRTAAIKQAIEKAQENDIVMILGLGIDTWTDGNNKTVIDADIVSKLLTKSLSG